jgi:uncharacterized membrane protein YfcA
VGVTQPHIAIGTGALAVSVNAFANFASHATRGRIWWRCAIVFAVLGSIAAGGGSTLGKAMDGGHLLFLFGLLMLVIATLMLRGRKNVDVPTRPVDTRMCITTSAVAVISGMASGFFGIGGGFLIVPGLMLATGMPMISAIGSSLLAVGAFGLATAVNYALSGMIDWPLAAEFIAGGVGGGLLGMLLATRLAVYKNFLNRIFAALIYVVAGYILYRSVADFIS